MNKELKPPNAPSSTKLGRKRQGTTSCPKICRRSLLFHKRLGTLLFVFPMVWYGLSGTLIALGRDFHIEQLYRFAQTWHSFQPTNPFTYYLINCFVAFSILAQFVSGVLVLRNTKAQKVKKSNLKTTSRHYHRRLSPLLGSLSLIFALTGLSNVLLRFYAPDSLYQLSRAFHNGSWLHFTWLCFLYNAFGGLGLMILALTGIASIRRKNTSPLSQPSPTK